MLFGKTISLVIPAHNEAEGLAHLLQDTPDYLDEIVIVDNNCTDDTAEVCRGFGCRVVAEPKQGYGAALKAGFRAATGEIIMTMDADGTCLFESYRRMIKHLAEHDLDFITGRRVPDRFRTLVSLMRFFGDIFLDVVCWSLFRFWVFDSQSGLWVFRRDLLERVKLESDGWALSEEFKIEAFTDPSVKAAELPVLYINIRLGESKLRIWRDGFANLRFMLKKWRQKKRTRPPSPRSR
jgi:dolichol-phosphate hexosyltransferase